MRKKVRVLHIFTFFLKIIIKFTFNSLEKNFLNIENGILLVINVLLK